MRKWIRRRRTESAIIASILFHILFIWLFPPFYEALVRMAPEVAVKEAPVLEPLVFDLMQPELPNLVVENPMADNSDQPPEDPAFLSDRHSEARDSAPDADLPVTNMPFTEGVLPDAYEIVDGAGEGEEFPMENMQDEQITEEYEETEPEERSPFDEGPALATLTPRTAPKFSRDFLTNPPPPSLEGLSGQHLLENERTRAERLGGLSLSTYNWDYAPYLLYLKREVGRHIFPPAAFNQLGMIDGETLLRFSIQRDGHMTDLIVIEFKGHQSLVETSTMAIKLAADFRALPDHFPEDVLVVTGLFKFTVLRNR